jgi:hypothetical protein
MKGVRFVPISHECLGDEYGYKRRLGYGKRCGYEKRIEIAFDDGPVNVIPHGPRVTCALGLRRDEQRITAAEKFAKAIRLDRSEVKERLKVMLLELEEVADMVKTHKG